MAVPVEEAIAALSTFSLEVIFSLSFAISLVTDQNIYLFCLLIIVMRVQFEYHIV